MASASIPVCPVRIRGALSANEKHIILNVYRVTTNENLQWRVDTCVERTFKLTGVAKSTVYRILKNQREHGRQMDPIHDGGRRSINLDELENYQIKFIVHDFFSRNEVPTVRKVHQAIIQNEEMPKISLSSTHTQLKKLNFRYVKRGRKSMLIEREEIISWRRDYLRKIRRYREENRPIFYLDETWVNEGHVKSKIWVDCNITSYRQAFLDGLTTGLRNPSGKGRRLIILHIGSEQGFVEGGLLLFEGRKTSDYHFEENMVKAELLQLIKSFKQNFANQYAVDKMAIAQNKTVLRLPPYHCELNPIELIWAQIKGEIASKNTTFKLNDVRILTTDAIRNVTTDHWQNCIHHVITKEEERMWKLDGMIDDVVDELIINIGPASDSDTTDLEGVLVNWCWSLEDTQDYSCNYCFISTLILISEQYNTCSNPCKIKFKKKI